ncbi:hypothetical protein GCM10009555_043370 [Acrocarpospora macrocephala]|uniref:Uncharacterized protein n=1 Tax=Acrocarpospora macrocephala TaxID=150177 RepID=A0A5M3WFG2_9ACTN|nr:hypothetical protein Amac_005950 [Acrocarpospora macrocephala]
MIQIRAKGVEAARAAGGRDRPPGRMPGRRAGVGSRGGAERFSAYLPHHGSSRQSPAFLAATRSRAALISVGADNSYGHPAQTTISRLTWLGARVYRTDRAGDLAVIPHQGRLAVVSRGTS